MRSTDRGSSRPEQGVDAQANARELAIQRLKMKQDFKGILAGGPLSVVIAVVIWTIGGGRYFLSD